MMLKLKLKWMGLIPAWVLLAGAVPAAADENWQIASRDETNGSAFVLYSMRTGQEGLLRYRLETTLPVSPARAVEAVMDINTSQHFVQENQTREVLEETENGAVLYTTIDMPMMVSDRDMAFRVTASSGDANGAHRVEWNSVAAHPALPEARPGTVRVTVVEGHWEFRPDGPERCFATYVSLTDVGGSLPRWLIEPMMRSQMTGDAQSTLR